MAYNTPETVADYLARFQMEITHRGKGTFTPDHVKYSLTIASGGKDFFTTFESNPHVHGEPTITQVFGALASDAMVVRDYGMDEFVDEFCDGMKPSAAIRAYNSCKETLTSGTCITEAFGETAEYKVDDNYHALLTWLPDHTEWLEEAEFDGLLEGCKGDIYKMTQMAQYECFLQDLYSHREDICKNGTLSQLADAGIYAIEESVADDILDGLSYDGDYVQTDEAKDTIISAIYATFEEKYGEDFADCATDFIQDNDDIAGRVNPCAMSVETVRAVYGMGFDAVFLNDWKKELSECDIDPEAVSVDSEAHDMENGRDGLDGNAPEKDTPEKDDRDAQPPVDTDNR